MVIVVHTFCLYIWAASRDIRCMIHIVTQAYHVDVRVVSPSSLRASNRVVSSLSGFGLVQGEDIVHHLFPFTTQCTVVNRIL